MTWFREFHTITVMVSLVAILALTISPIIAYGWRSIRKQGAAFALIAAGFLVSMANKPPSVSFDYGLADSGSHYTSNSVSLTGVEFDWIKTVPALPSDEPLYISKRPVSGGDWEMFASTTVGAFSYVAMIANPTSYAYYVWHEWIPPSPVHTNVVWLGNVIEKAREDGSVGKYVIIKGILEENGRKLNK